MKELIAAIQDKFSDNGLDATITGGCWSFYAGQGVPLPYMTVDYGESAVQDLMGTTQDFIETYPVTMNIWTGIKNDEQESALALEHCLSLRDEVEAVFNDCDLTMASYHLLRFGRTSHGVSPDADLGWHATIQYEVTLEEA